MKKSIRDGVADLAMELCRMADRTHEEAKELALKSLYGDEKAGVEAKERFAMTTAYKLATKATDNLRVAIERGDFS